MKHILVVGLLSICIVSSAYAQDQRPTSKTENDKSLYELSYNYFSRDYNYLDDEYKIEISSTDFNLLVEKYAFYPEQIRHYKDSLSVILNENFLGDSKKAHTGKLILGYTWQRLSYHLWETPEVTENLARSFGFSHPFLFKRYIVENDQQKEVKKLLSNLREQITREIPDAELSKLSTDDLLNFAMRNSPQRIEDFLALKNEKKSDW